MRASPVHDEVTVVQAQRIHTMVGPPVDAVVISGGRVIAAGNAEDLCRRFDHGHVVDLDGVVVPGFQDAHAHPTEAAANALGIDLSPEVVTSQDQLASVLAAESAAATPTSWVLGSRYDQGKATGGRIIDRSWLDRVVPHRPALILHVAGHWGILNTLGLHAAGLNDASTDPAGGALGRDGKGRLNGVLYEQALFDVAYPSMARQPVPLPPRSISERLQGWEATQKLFHAAGITSVCDALCSPQDVELLAEARRRGELTLRTSFLVAYPHLDSVLRMGLRSGFGDHDLRLVGIKAMLDGACAGATCLVEEPFVGTNDHGIQTMPAEDVLELLHHCDSHGLALGMHANGDRAIRLLLDAHEALPSPIEERPRHRVEHCTLIDEDIVARLGTQELVAVPFGSYAWFHGDKLEAMYGAERLERMFAHRTLIDAGVPTAGASDYPCGPVEVIAALDSCVNRLGSHGSPVGGTQRITVQEALRAYTVGAAYACGEETDKGTLAPGMLADFVELSEDPYQVAADRLVELSVRSTWVGGAMVHQR